MPMALSPVFFTDVSNGGTVFQAVGMPDLVSPAEWYINGQNGVFFSDGFGGGGNFSPSVFDADGGVQMDIASWSNPVAVASAPSATAPSATPVPALPLFGLLTLGGLLGLFGLRKLKQ